MTAESQEKTNLELKSQFKARVLKVTLAGAALDIGIGKPALLHVSQIAVPENAPNNKVDEILKPGDEIDVWVKKITRKDGEERIEMTMIRPLDLEWREIKVGDTVKGKVVRLEKFGAFVEIGAERPGLVHISEMAHGFVKAAEDVVKEGDEIQAMILDVDRKKKQIKLSMKALLPEPEKTEETTPRAKSGSSSPRGERKGGRRRENATEDYSAYLVSETPAEPELTAMEIAYRDAMGKAKSKRSIAQEKHKRAEAEERDEIFSRTLTNKIKTS